MLGVIIVVVESFLIGLCVAVVVLEISLRVTGLFTRWAGRLGRLCWLWYAGITSYWFRQFLYLGCPGASFLESHPRPLKSLFDEKFDRNVVVVNKGRYNESALELLDVPESGISKSTK